MQILIIHDMLIPNPFSLKTVNNFNSSPPFGPSGLYDITIWFKLIPLHWLRQAETYKSFVDYRLFSDGYVESLLTAQLNQEGVHVYIAKVRLFMEIKTDEERSTTISGLFLRVEVQTEVAYFRQDRV